MAKPKPKLVAIIVSALVIAGAVGFIGYTQLADDSTDLQVRSGESLQDAVKSAPNGATLVLHRGAKTDLRIKNKTWAEPITIKGSPEGSAPIKDINIENTSGMKLDNVLLTGISTFKNSSDLAVTNSQTGTLRFRDGSHHVLVENNKIEGGGDGVWLRSSVTASTPPIHNVVIRGNTISGQTQDNIHMGVANDITIEDNNLTDAQDSENHNDGVQILAGERITIRRNHFSNHDQAILLKAEPTVFKDQEVSVKDVRIENNVIVRERGAGIIVNRSADVEVVNNTIFGNRYADVHIDGPQTGLRVLNNVMSELFVLRNMEGPAEENYNCFAKGKGADDVKGDPQFKDDGSYQIADNSPCRRIGNSDIAPDDDINKKKRGSKVDAGAVQVS